MPYNPHIDYQQSQSTQQGVDQQVLRFPTRTIFLIHVLLLVASFFIGINIVSSIDESKAATNFYIATNGNDANPCSQAAPCLTMNRAYAVAAAGDTVFINAGTYGNQTITGTKGSWVYFKPTSGAAVRLGNLHTNADFVDVSDVDVSQWQITATNVNDVTLRNVDVLGYLGYSGNGTQRISMYGGSVGPGVDYHPQIAPAAGNGSAWATDLLFDGVYWHDWTRTNSGVHTECLQVAGTTRFTMRNNKFERCAIFDLSFTGYNGSGYPVDVLLENNLFATTTGNGSINDGYYALNYGDMTNVTIKNNTFGQGINENLRNQNVRLIGNILLSAWNCLDATYQYNVYQWTSNLNCGATDKWVSGPQYSLSNIGIVGSATTANGLYLSANSQAKDFIAPSVASSLGLPTSDIDGHSRPVGTNYDAGADEYGSSGGVTPPPPPPPVPSAPVVSISANPSSLQQGNASTLTWSSTNAPTSCTASGDWSGSKSASGSQSTGTLSTVKTYTYTLACTNAGGTGSASATVAVTATPPPSPTKPTITLSVSPSTINSGASSTISWSATNSPTSCTASGDWSGSKSASGSQSTGTLSTVKTYTYTLTCSNAGGSTTGSVALVVIPTKPSVTISLSPSTINSGASSTISWSSTNSPTSCAATGDWSGSKSASGSQSTGTISSGTSKTYTITCSNAGGSATASAALSISTSTAPINPNVPKPAVNLTATPSTIESGQKSTLNWTTGNSPTSCTASGDWSGSKPSAGTENTAALTAGKTYTLTCSNAGGSTSASASVSIVIITQAGNVKVNDTPVPNLKVDNPSIVGETIATPPQPIKPAETSTAIAPPASVKTKLVAAGLFSGLITLTVAAWVVTRYILHKRHLAKNPLASMGPGDVIGK